MQLTQYKKWFVLVWFFPAIATWYVTQHFGYVINVTTSLPQKFFIIHLKKMPKVGDYVLFKPLAKAGLPPEINLAKQVLGSEGDIVTRHGLDFYINDRWVAKIKTNSLLKAGPTGVLREGQYYVSTPHAESFDSRYEAIGWVHHSQCIGVLYPVW